MCFPFSVNAFELLHLLSKYRTAKRQAEEVLGGNSCWVEREEVCVLCVADNMTAICFTEGWQETEVNNVCECVWESDLSISAVLLIQAMLCGGLLLAEMTTASILSCRESLLRFLLHLSLVISISVGVFNWHFPSFLHCLVLSLVL